MESSYSLIGDSMSNLQYSLLLCTLAGISTLLGAFFIFIPCKDYKKLIAFALSFSAGVMLSISLLELLPESFVMIQSRYPFSFSFLLTLFFVNLGLVIANIFDQKIQSDNSLYKVGIVSMLALFLHNIPEGIATFLTTNTNPKLGLLLAISIALHNIPEGISIFIPIYFATRKKGKAFFCTFFSALSEILGGLFAFFFLRNLITEWRMGYLYALITGFMAYIAFYELLPTAWKYPYKKLIKGAFLVGFLFMMGLQFCF